MVKNTKYKIQNAIGKLRQLFIDANASPFRPFSPSQLSTIADSLIKDYKDGKIAPITVGWDEHVFAISFLRDKIIVTNRGNGSDATTGYSCNIYQIPKDHIDKINTEIFENLLKTTDFGKYKAEYVIEEQLMKIGVNLKKPFKNIDLKKQRHDTCGFVNIKSSILGILYILGASDPYGEYKKFTKFIRDSEVEELIADYKNASTPGYKEMMAEILLMTIEQHHGQNDRTSDVKKEDELRRAQLIYNSLDPKHQDMLDADIVNKFSDGKQALDI